MKYATCVWMFTIGFIFLIVANLGKPLTYSTLFMGLSGMIFCCGGMIVLAIIKDEEGKK